MCLIFFSYNLHERYRLVLAANRDEFYERPTKPLDFWEESPHILGGRDMKGMGTWMGITRGGRLAAITNFRDLASLKTDAPSRGLLVSNFLAGKATPETCLEHISHIGHRYNGFNLLIGDGSGLFYYSNRGNCVQKLSPGLYGLCNHLLDTPWPKVEKGKAEFEILLEKNEMKHSSCSGPDDEFYENIFKLLGNRNCPPDDTLPDTGVGPAWERILSPLFVFSDTYGTRSSSIVLIERTGKMIFLERTFVPKSGDVFEQETRKFELKVKS